MGESPSRAGTARAPDLVDTAPLRSDALRGAAKILGRESLAVGSAQSAGVERESNEDSLLLLYSTAFGEEAPPQFGLFCVADGAGGLGNGELASSIAVKSIASSMLKEALLQAIDNEGEVRNEAVKEATKRAFEQANQAVIAGANGGVTTLTMAILLEDRLTIGHVGDSRAYLINGQSMKQLTRDHSYAWRLVEIGQIGAEEAHLHPKRNQLWNAIGQGANVVVEVETHPLPRDGYLLLCSDGLWGEVPDNEIRAIIAESHEPNETCERLVEAANNAGGADNISALLISFPAR